MHNNKYLPTIIMYDKLPFQTIPMELPVVKREYQNGMYSTLPYFISKICAEIPFIVLLPLIQISISYFMIGRLSFPSPICRISHNYSFCSNH